MTRPADRTWRNIGALAVLIVIVACSDSTRVANVPFSGSYALESVDGNPLPTVVPHGFPIGHGALVVASADTLYITSDMTLATRVFPERAAYRLSGARLTTTYTYTLLHGADTGTVDAAGVTLREHTVDSTGQWTVATFRYVR